LKSFETKAVAAGLCKQDMNRFYKKPTVNPAFKLCQPLPLPAMTLKGKGSEQRNVPVTGLDKNLMLTANVPPRGHLISLCKNFAFSNLF
jgi:hypothetical protein